MEQLSEQERVWAGKFGDEYNTRNASPSLLASNVALFGRILSRAPGVRSILELGCNIGMNLRALHQISPEFALDGYDINAAAVAQARALGYANVKEGSIAAALDGVTRDMTFTKGVLIHVSPDDLFKVYANLYRHSARYIMVCEYYNPSPVSVSYRGEEGKLFKRDFAGEMMSAFPDLRLLDYGFAYRRDNYFPQDDLTWFLLEK